MTKRPDPSRRILLPSQEEVDALLRSDIPSFLAKVFIELNPGVPFAGNFHHEAMAAALMEVMSGNCKRLNISVPPRYLKSITASVAFPAFVLGHNPAKRIICVSYSQGLADKHSRDCRATMESDWYHRLFPGTCLSTSTESHLVTTARGERFATSVGGTLTGLGADIIIVDDPLKPQDAYSEVARRAAREFYSGTLLSRLNDKNTGAIINVAQRLHPDDLTGLMLEEKGWKNLSLPAIAETDEIIPLMNGRSHLRRQGDVLHPERESKSLLDRIKANLGSAVFEAQYQQNPLPADSDLIRRAWFRTYADVDFAGGRSIEVVQSWDVATSDKETADWSVCTTWWVKDDVYYLIDVFRARLRYPDLKRKIVSLAQTYGCTCVLIENKGTGQALIQELQESGPIYPIPITPVHDKITRLAANTAVIEAGRVRLPMAAPWLEDFFAEVLRFPYGPHDDQVDSMSQVLSYMETRRFPAVFRRQF